MWRLIELVSLQTLFLAVGQMLLKLVLLKLGKLEWNWAYKHSEPRQAMLVGVPVVGGRRPTFPRFRAVSSALRGLTSLFGMGRGAPPR